MAKLEELVKRNRIRMARYKRAERVLRYCRLHIFDFEDESTEKYEKARRVMDTCKRILDPYWEARRKTLENASQREAVRKSGI